MLNFIVFDHQGQRLGEFELRGGSIVSESNPKLSSPLVGYLDSMYKKGGPEAIYRYATSLQAYSSGYILRENPGGVG